MNISEAKRKAYDALVHYVQAENAAVVLTSDLTEFYKKFIDADLELDRIIAYEKSQAFLVN